MAEADPDSPDGVAPLRPLGGRAASLRAQGVPRGKMGAPGSGRPLITTVAPWAIPTTNRAGPSSSTARFQPRGTTRAWAPPAPGEPATSPSKRGAASLAPTPSSAPPEPNAAPLAFLNQCPGLSGAARGVGITRRTRISRDPSPTPPLSARPGPTPDRRPFRAHLRSRPPSLARTLARTARAHAHPSSPRIHASIRQRRAPPRGDGGVRRPLLRPMDGFRGSSGGGFGSKNKKRRRLFLPLGDSNPDRRARVPAHVLLARV